MEAHLDAATTTRVKVDGLYEIVAETSLVGSYSKNADRERTAANRWRIVALVAAGFAVAIGVWAAIVADNNGTDWDLLAAKGGLAAVVTGVAAYAARQSSEHRTTQRDADHVAVQLTALKPYLNDLTEVTERDALLVEIARRLFGQSRVTAKDADELGKLVNAVGDNPSALAAVLSAVKALTKSS